jgi:16S rRNA (cytosine1402-N4)-methyltransferase
MKHSATLSEARARAPWPLPEPTLTYFPNARFVLSGRDLDAGARRIWAQVTGRSQAQRSRAQRVDRSVQRREGVLVPDATGGFGHVPVLLDRCVALLTPALTRHHSDGSGAVLIDATIGAGGHAERFLTELPGLRLIGVDRDPTALDIARTRLARFADRLTLIQTRYDGIGAALAGCPPVRRAGAGTAW